MGMLRVLSQRGDDRTTWNNEAALAGDVDQKAAVAEAERIFAKQRAQGATAFVKAPGVPAKPITRFDPSIEADIILVPRVVGG